MAFRTIEIRKPAELHMKNGQLEICQEEGGVVIQVEDVSQIFCIGLDIRIREKRIIRREFLEKMGILCYNINTEYRIAFLI